MKGKTMTKKQKEKVEAIEYLKQHIKAGDTLYTKLEKVSSSGMSRQIKVLDIKDETPSYWSYYVSKILGYTLKDNGSLVVKGCGMDMGFHVIYSLSQTLFNDGYAIKQRWI
jgi:ribose 5-phosphate isomerase RpiB